MTLAWQMREWDLDAFEMQIPARTMCRWREWFRRRPQGQLHQDRFAALVASGICAANGAELPPEHFMFYEPKKPPEKPSQQQIDAGVEKLKVFAAKMQQRRQGTEGKQCQTSAT